MNDILDEYTRLMAQAEYYREIDPEYSEYLEKLAQEIISK